MLSKVDEDNEGQNHNGKRLLKLLQSEYPSYHPLIALVKLAHDTKDPRVEMGCHATVAKYVEPEIKSIEIKSSVRKDYGVLRIVKSEELLQEQSPENIKGIEHKSDFEEFNMSAPVKDTEAIEVYAEEIDE